MGVEDNFPVPPGDPARVIAAGRALGGLAGEVSGGGRRVAAERAGMAAVWSGDAGSAAVYETGTAGEITSDYGRRVGEGGAALSEYGRVLDQVITEVNGIRAQARQAYTDAWHEVSKHWRELSSEDRQAEVDGLVGPTLRGLGIQYHYEDQALRAAAEKAAGALTGLVPFYWPGMKVELLSELARGGVASGLPMLQRADGERIGNALGDKAKPYLDKGQRIPDDLLAEIERNRLNPWFAKTFLEKLGPRMPSWVVAVSKGQGFPAAYNERVITVFGQLLAQGTRSTGPARLSDKYVDDLLAPMDQHNGAGAVSARELSLYLVVGGTFGRDFLKKFGDKLDALERDYSLAPITLYSDPWMTTTEVPSDPFESYFHALSFNPDAAQDFFLNSDRLHYYVVDRPLDDYLGDHGKSLGEALVAATTVYRNAEPTGLRSAQITANLLNTMGELSHDWLDEHSRQELRPAIATVLTSYADDIYYTLSRRDLPVISLQDPNLPPGVRAGNKELGTNLYGISVDLDKLRQVLGQVDHDVQAYKRVITSQLVSAAKFLDANLAYIRAHPDERRDTLLRFGSGYGRVLDTLFGTHMEVQHDIAVARNEEHDFNKSMFLLGTLSVVNVALAVLPWVIPGGLVARLGFNVAVSIVMPWIINAATKSSNTDAADAKAIKDLNDWWLINQFILIDRMQNGGAFAGTPADANTWMKEHGIPPEGRFTDADGKVIPQEQMTDAQLDAYARWHRDGSASGVGQETAQLNDAIESQVHNPPSIK
jgi:hypothetical protein